MQGIKLDTLENIEMVMPKIQKVLEGDGNEKTVLMAGAPTVAPLAEAIVTLAREIRVIKERLDKKA